MSTGNVCLALVSASGIRAGTRPWTPRQLSKPLWCLQTLDLIREQCCDGEAGPCTGVLADIQTEKKWDVCSSPGNHCDADGEITHLDLSESNMKCNLADAEFPLIEMKKLQVCASPLPRAL